MSLTWEDVEESPRILERGPVSPKKQALVGERTPHTRVVVDGRVVLVFGATDAYDAVNKALEAVEARKPKPKRTTKAKTPRAE